MIAGLLHACLVLIQHAHASGHGHIMTELIQHAPPKHADSPASVLIWWNSTKLKLGLLMVFQTPTNSMVFLFLNHNSIKGLGLPEIKYQSRGGDTAVSPPHFQHAAAIPTAGLESYHRRQSATNLMPQAGNLFVDKVHPAVSVYSSALPEALRCRTDGGIASCVFVGNLRFCCHVALFYTA